MGLTDILSNLEAVTLTGRFSKAPGVNIDGALLNNALVNVLSGDACPQTTFTIGIHGRGSLVMAEPEFVDLLAAMMSMWSSHTMPEGEIVEAPAVD